MNYVNQLTKPFFLFGIAFNWAVSFFAYSLPIRSTDRFVYSVLNHFVYLVPIFSVNLSSMTQLSQHYVHICAWLCVLVSSLPSLLCA